MIYMPGLKNGCFTTILFPANQKGRPDMQERLQKILSSRGIASRRKAEDLIRNGLVTVNGVVAVLGDTADADTDTICVEGHVIPGQPQAVYIMLNKPRGYVTTLSDEKGRKNAAQLVEDCGTRVYPVGRLDMDSEGLLIFTNDGSFANALMHPKLEVKKTYDTWVTGYVPGAEIRLSKPVTLDGYTIRPPKVRLIRAEGNKAKFRITIHEGRNRQVRRMCELAGMQVTRLRRVREGTLQLGELPVGKWRDLTEGDVKAPQNEGAVSQ